MVVQLECRQDANVTTSRTGTPTRATVAQAAPSMPSRVGGTYGGPAGLAHAQAERASESGDEASPTIAITPTMAARTRAGANRWRAMANAIAAATAASARKNRLAAGCSAMLWSNASDAAATTARSVAAKARAARRSGRESGRLGAPMTAPTMRRPITVRIAHQTPKVTIAMPATSKIT